MEPTTAPPQESFTSEKTLFKFESLTKEKHQSRHAITIGRTPQEIFSFLRNLDNLTRVIKGVDLIMPINNEDSRWTSILKNGEPFDWQVTIREKIAGESLHWSSSADGSTTKTSGDVHLARASDGRGTVVALTMNYSVPGGKVGEWLAFLGGHDPDTLAQINLHRLKAYLETGEIPTTDGQSTGRSEDLEPIQH